jgi:hypothetical protein
MTNTVELTPAELEMIKVKREQEALVQKEIAAKKALQLEKEIADQKERITKITIKDAAQVKACQDFNVEFDNQYSVVIKTWEEIAVVKGEYIDPEHKDGNYERETFWQGAIARQSATIYHKAGYTIQVEEQIVYSSSWRSTGTSKGYKMYVSGPGIEYKQERQALSRPSSVMEKVKKAMEKVAEEIAYKNKQKVALQTTVDKFKAEYPDAEVTTDKGWERGYSRSYSGGTTYDMVRVKFVNGAQIAYRVYADGSLSRVSFNLPGYKDEAAFMKNLSQMKF